MTPFRTGVATALVATHRPVTLVANRSPSASQLTEDAARVVTVAMKDIAFEPVGIEVERGALVRLAFQNTGVLHHDFTIEHMSVEDMRAEGRSDLRQSR